MTSVFCFQSPVRFIFLGVQGYLTKLVAETHLNTLTRALVMEVRKRRESQGTGFYAPIEDGQGRFEALSFSHDHWHRSMNPDAVVQPIGTILSAGFHHPACTALLMQVQGASFFYPHHGFVSTTDTTKAL